MCNVMCVSEPTDKTWNHPISYNQCSMCVSEIEIPNQTPIQSCNHFSRTYSIPHMKNLCQYIASNVWNECKKCFVWVILILCTGMDYTNSVILLWLGLTYIAHTVCCVHFLLLLCILYIIEPFSSIL